MLDQNDLQAIAQLMEQQKKDILESVKQETNALREIMQQQMDTVQDMLADTEHRMKVYIENDVGKRIDSLFDGYKLTHEKQWELERETEKLKEQVNDLQTRLALIEKKISA